MFLVKLIIFIGRTSIFDTHLLWYYFWSCLKRILNRFVLLLWANASHFVFVLGLLWVMSKLSIHLDLVWKWSFWLLKSYTLKFRLIIILITCFCLIFIVLRVYYWIPAKVKLYLSLFLYHFFVYFLLST